ncbi:hypothetical protein FDUTEX481_06403 [Tolypothrix sp. PCC 7601]|nr:hypothetical protein FDUTEX481_06403 [Tolypothrix sp. PCC 7601]
MRKSLQAYSCQAAQVKLYWDLNIFEKEISLKPLQAKGNTPNTQ